MKCHKLDDLKQEFASFTVLEATSPESWCRQGHALSPAFQWFPAIRWALCFVAAHFRSLPLSLCLVSSQKDTVILWGRPTLCQCDLIFHPKDPVSKSGYNYRWQGKGLLCIFLGGAGPPTMTISGQSFNPLNVPSVFGLPGPSPGPIVLGGSS